MEEGWRGHFSGNIWQPTVCDSWDRHLEQLSENLGRDQYDQIKLPPSRETNQIVIFVVYEGFIQNLA